MIDFGTGIGLALSLVQFIWDQMNGKQAAHEFKREIEADRTIRDYLEWLRRQNYDELIHRIGTNEDKLLRELGNLGTDIHGLTNRVLGELQKSGDEIAKRVRELNVRFTLPVLSPVPLRTRPLTTVPLLARNSEMARLQQTTTDIVVSGQPGSGKTFLLYHFAQQCSGRFVLTKDPDTAVSAVINGCPPVLIVDDAARQTDLLRRLIHARREHGLSFMLIAVCWPFELEDVLYAMELPKASALELTLLPRSVIAELIQSVVKDAGYQAPNDVVREINNQATGRPGLAVALTQASLHEDFLAVMRGDTLAQVMEKLFESIVGGNAAQIMAAFSVGGKAGMEMETVSRVMGISILDLHTAVKDMAPGGVLEPISKTRLMGIPRAMRRAILKDVFFKPKGICLPRFIFEALLNSAPDHDEAIHSLLESAQAGADIDQAWLQSIISGCSSPKVWDAYAWLGADQCQFIMRNHPAMTPHIVDAALHYTPSLIITQMLSSAVNDTRALNSHPDTPLRKLADWVTHARPNTTDAVERRQVLLDSIKNWLDTGGDRATAFHALEPCFSLGFEMTEEDPGDGMKMTFSSGLLPLDNIDAIAALWPKFHEIARKHGIQDWKPFTEIIQGWIYPSSRFGQAGGDDYRAKTLPVAQRMIVDLVELCGAHNGFLRWAYIHAMEAGIDPSIIPVNEEFLRLYPVEHLSEDWQAEDKKNAENAEELVQSWEQLQFSEIIARLKRYESEAASMAHNWPRLSTYVCQLLAERHEESEANIIALITSGVPADLVDPFLVAAFKRGLSVDAALRECIVNDHYRHLAILHTLMCQSPQLFPDISSFLPNYTEYIEHLERGGNAPEDIMQALLTHKDKRVRLVAALLEFRSAPKEQVREGLKSEWRTAIAEGMAEYERARDLRHFYDLDKIIAYDRTLAFEILMAMASRDELSLSMWDLAPIMPLISALNREERLKLLDASKTLLLTEVPKVLIGNDTNLYRQFLANPEMNRHHLTPLIGSPISDGWADKALLALGAGYSVKDIAFAARGSHWSGIGPMSNMWQKWIDEFKPLLGHKDPRVQAIGQAGIEWSTTYRDEALAREKHDDIYGRFNE